VTKFYWGLADAGVASRAERLTVGVGLGEEDERATYKAAGQNRERRLKRRENEGRPVFKTNVFAVTRE
jgi:hypothetical protein